MVDEKVDAEPGLVAADLENVYPGKMTAEPDPEKVGTETG